MKPTIAMAIFENQYIIGFIVSIIMGALAFLIKATSLSGVIGGVIFGTIIYGATGWQGFLVPLSFVAIGTLATKHKYLEKLEMGIAQESGGRRSAKHALANILAGTIFAVLSSVFPHGIFHGFFIACMVGAFATASSDTASSEMGQVYGKNPINPITFKSVKRGTDGAISLEGTLWGIVASIIVAVIAALGQLFWWPVMFAVILGAFIGNYVESLIGASGSKEINNELLNFMNTLIGALASGFLAILILRMARLF